MTLTASPAEVEKWKAWAADAKRAERHPAYLLAHTRCIDAKTGDEFVFEVSDEDVARGAGWCWQREVLDWWLDTEKTIVLKARQLGVTWLSSGMALWYLLYRPGSKVLAVSINEEEAAAIVERTWTQLESLPRVFLRGTTVLKPSRGHRPHTEIELRHPDGRISTMLALPSTKKAGHGQTAAFVILDEFSRQDYARDTWKAVIPTMADGGKVAVISTANGVSNDLTGEGNFYHHLWVHSDEYGLEHRFLRWDLHPQRDDGWYLKNASTLPVKDRAEQYPRDEHEAFILTGDIYFDADALAWYGKKATREPLYRGRFVRIGGKKAAFKRLPGGELSVYEEPAVSDVVVDESSVVRSPHKYAIAADIATGRGFDFSCAYVIDLSTMALVAELYGKLDADIFTEQLHFLGRWYNTAIIAVESTGGYGDSVIIQLRDGREGRPAYPKLYRHRQFQRADAHQNHQFGFPTNQKTRPLILDTMEKVIREHSLPYMAHGLLQECQTFVYAKTNPSPRAQDGCNDDRVLACAMVLEMYRQFGYHPLHGRRKVTKKPKVPYPWNDQGLNLAPLDE